MKSTLPAMHVIWHFLLFVLTVVFLLTMIRAGLALWQFSAVDEADALVALFVQGLRFDLALVGIICFVPIVLGSLMSVVDSLRGVAKFIITLFLVSGLVLILILECITPWFIDTQGIRPDLSTLQNLSSPVSLVKGVVTEHPIPAGVAILLSVLIVIAFWARMELARFLRYRLSVPAGLVSAVLGGALCLLFIWSPIALDRKLPLGPGDALISVNTTVNELAMNSTYKFLHSIVLPFFQ